MKRKTNLLITTLAILFFLAGCVTVNESFKQGQNFAKENRWEEAMVFFQKALSEEPNNKEFQEELAKAKSEAAKIRMARTRQAVAAAGDNLFALEKLAKDAEVILSMSPTNPEMKAFHTGLQDKVNGLKANLKNLYAQAETDLQKEDWVAALAKLNQINRMFPNYEDTGNRIRRAQQEGVRVLYQQGGSFAKQDDWKAAAEAFKTAMEINPNYLDVTRQFNEAKQKDTLDYYLKEAAKAEEAKRWERAIFLYERAMDYPQADAAIGKKIDDLKDKASMVYFEESVQWMKQDKLYGALKRLELAVKYAPAMRNDALYKEHANNLCAALMKRAEKLMEKEMWGNALVWMQKAESLNPAFPDLFQKMNDIKDPINKRVRKSIAVFDFGSPSNEKDAGKIAANKLIAFLHKNASVDLRIIERENLQSILREMQLSQTGLVDIKTAQNVGKMRGIDTFIMGDVLHFSTKYTDNPTINQVKVLVDEEDVRNPEFSDWLLVNPKPSPDDLKNAPPRTIKKRNFQLVSYKSGVARINSMLEISFKLVDTQTGEIIANTVSGRLIKEDKYQDGLPIASIVQDPLDLPTEAEVLDEITNDKISEMGRHILKHYQSLEVEYFNRGQDLQRRRNFDAAIEKYIDAVFDERMKGISTPISQKSLEIVEKLIEDR